MSSTRVPTLRISSTAIQTGCGITVDVIYPVIGFPNLLIVSIRASPVEFYSHALLDTKTLHQHSHYLSLPSLAMVFDAHKHIWRHVHTYRYNEKYTRLSCKIPDFRRSLASKREEVRQKHISSPQRKVRDLQAAVAGASGFSAWIEFSCELCEWRSLD